RKGFTLLLAFCMLFHMSVLAEEAICEGYPKPEHFVKLKIPFPETLKDNDSWRTVARYQDSGTAIPLSDCFGEYVYAIVPYENKDRPIEAFVPDKSPFVDYDSSRYEFHVMDNLSRVGVILGNEKGEALPFANVTRAEATAMIMRFLGISSLVNADMPFADVARSDWFYGNVATLYEAGIVMGDSETTFSPHRNVTREEITTMVVRALQYADLRCPLRTEENIADLDSVSDWAKEAYQYIGTNYVSDYEGEDTDRPYRMLYP
ncbi:MAG: S-layer homology domain-containing protein, partial [Clostridia bacterium]|nr:S-layer homology domain-containing protein [Clostridia bacterium]